MNAHTPTSDIVDQLKSLSIDRVDRAPLKKTQRSSPTKSVPWKTMILTGMVAAIGAAAWHNDVRPVDVFNGLLASTSTEAPPLQKAAVPVQQAIAAQTSTAISVPAFTPSVVGSGYVIADREATLTPDISGRIVEVRVAIGDMISKGDVVAVLNSDAAQADLRISKAYLAMSQAKEAVADAALAQARADVEIKATLAQRGNVAKVVVDEARLTAQRLEGDLAVAQQATAIAALEIAKQQDYLDRHIVTAPFTGVVVARHLNGGDIVASGLEGPSEGIVSVITPNALTIEVEVAENNLGTLTPGQMAAVSLDAWPNKTFDARVMTIAPKASIQRGTVQVRLSFETPPLGVFANMAAKVTFKGPQSTTENQ